MTPVRPATGQRSDTVQHARQHRRSLQILQATGGLMLLFGLAWAAFFASRGDHQMLVVELVLAGLGALVIVTTRLQQPRLGAWIAFAGLLGFICLFSAVFDVQTAQIPRTTHLFLLVLAAAAHHVFRNEPALLRYGWVLLFLLAFIFFAALPDALHSQHAITPRVRRIGIWVNLVTVATSLMVILHLQESDVAAHSTLHHELRDALSKRHFELFFQPQVNAQGRIIGAEALLRWRDPRRGLVAPGEFIQAAEETGFILPLGQWVIDAACEQLRRWQQYPQLSQLTLSINVSPMQLQQPDFVQHVLTALQRTGVRSQLLTLELTESMLLDDMDAVIAKMGALQAAGVRLSLDDFGTGYSALSYLRTMPLSELKIDRVFVAEIIRNAQARSITRNLLALGHDLGIDVIAEGIELPGQQTVLLEQGCRYFQGYLFGQPMPAAAFEQQVITA